MNIEAIDAAIKDFGVNPYVITVGFVVTVAPVLWALLKLLLQLYQFVAGAIRNGIRSQFKRRFKRNLKKKLRINSDGFLEMPDLDSFDTYVAVKSAFLNTIMIFLTFCFFYLVGSTAGIETAAAVALTASAGSALIFGTQTYIEILDLYWLLRFSQRTIQKNRAFISLKLAKAKAELVELAESSPELVAS